MRLIHRPLLVGVLHVVKFPRRVLLVAGLALAGCIGLAMWRLNIATDQNRLFDPKVRFFRDFLSFSDKFPENEAIYIIIEPADSRSTLLTALEIATRHDDGREFRTGVLQV